LKPWQNKEWCIPAKENAEFVCAMEDVLDVYNPPCQDSCRRPKPHDRWCGRNTGAIPLSPTDRGFDELYTVAPENAWFKIKGKNKLTGKQLSIIQTLAQWREKPRNSRIGQKAGCCVMNYFLI
jgi:hypothetical protein